MRTLTASFFPSVFSALRYFLLPMATGRSFSYSSQTSSSTLRFPGSEADDFLPNLQEKPDMPVPENHDQ